jgi:hypothetical protein
MYSDTLTRDDAVKVAKAWVESHVEAPVKYRGWNQFRWLLDQLAACCLSECLKNEEDTEQLYERLSKTHDILWNVWHAGAPEIATRWWKENEKPSEAEQKIIDKARVTVWKRRDPKRSFEEGFESEHYTAFNQSDFHATVADYLQERWLRHPVLDWVMVDMMVSRELSAFGEELKKTFMPGPRDDLFFGVHARYYKTNGDLQKMKMPDWESIWTKAFWAIGAPAGAIYGAFHFGYEGLGASLLGLYAATIAGWVGLKVLRFIIRVGYAIVGKTHPRAKPFLLWDQMYQVWKLLEPPIVNATLVREMMVKTRDQGAVWDSPVWSIIDRVIQHDPAVWVVQPTRS